MIQQPLKFCLNHLYGILFQEMHITANIYVGCSVPVFTQYGNSLCHHLLPIYGMSSRKHNQICCGKIFIWLLSPGPAHILNFLSITESIKAFFQIFFNRAKNEQAKPWMLNFLHRLHQKQCLGFERVDFSSCHHKKVIFPDTIFLPDCLSDLR